MKKSIYILFAILASCSKEPLPKEEPVMDNVIFWTNEVSVEQPSWKGYYLWIDGQKIGLIPTPYQISNKNQIPQCGDERFKNMHLEEGKHFYHLTLTVPHQLPPNRDFITDTIEFTVSGPCTIVRLEALYNHRLK